jgi:hypothetical protein
VSEWAHYRKRPVVVQAKELEQRVEIETREGTVVGEPGDYLLVGVDAEVYPCDPEIFDATYDRVADLGERPDAADVVDVDIEDGVVR